MLYLRAAAVFNETPKLLEQFLVDNDLLPADHSVKDVAVQLRRMNQINKRTLGEWLSKPGHEELLLRFIEDMNFAGRRLDEALRLMLESFRLPGESQQIGRIMEVFAGAFYQQQKHADSQQGGVFADQDAVYILAYWAIMLNTDQHNRQVRHPMTETDFIRNVRGMNGGKDFDPSYLSAIFNEIRTNEILMPEEHKGDLAFNYQWSEMLYSAGLHLPGRRQSVPVRLVARELLDLIWEPFLASLGRIIEQQLQTSSDPSMQTAVRALGELAGTVANLGQPNRMDELINVVWEASSIVKLFNSANGNLIPRYLAKVEIGRDLVGLLIDIFKRHGEVIKTGWKQLVELVYILHESRVIGSDAFYSATDLANIATSPRASRPSSRRSHGGMASSDGLLASLASYLSYVNGSEPSSPALSPAEAEAIQRATEFLGGTCHFEDIFRESRMLSADGLSSMLTAFLQVVAPHVSSSWTRASRALAIDICVYCALQNRDRLGAVWEVVYDGLADVCLRGSDDVLREHAILGLGRLALKMSEREEDMSKQVLQFLELLCNLPPEAVLPVAEQTLAVLLRIVEADSANDVARQWRLLDCPAVWPHYFTIMSLVSRHHRCAPYTLGLLMAVLSPEDRFRFPWEFFEEYLELLTSFIASFSTPPVDPSQAPAVPITDLARTAVMRLAGVDAVVRRAGGERGDDLQGAALVQKILSVHSALAKSCSHPLREVRQASLASLQRLTLAAGWSSAEEVVAEFEEVLFPLLDVLQKPVNDLSRSATNAFEDTQMSAASLVSKVFLNNVSILLPHKQQPEAPVRSVLKTLLGKLLSFLRFRSDTLREGIPETVKNLLFVLKSAGILMPENGELWAEVWQLIDQVLPDLRAELFPTPTPEPTASSTPDAAASSSPPDRSDPSPLLTGSSATAKPSAPVASPSAVHFV